jgi:hypothetical protein
MWSELLRQALPGDRPVIERYALYVLDWVVKREESSCSRHYRGSFQGFRYIS